MENLQLVYPPQGIGNSGQLENVTTVLAMALSALRMDES